MKKSHRDAASELQHVGAMRHWHITLEGNAISLAKQFGNTVVSCILLREDDEYNLQPFTYTFHSKISFFDYQTPENRYARNQMYFASLFRLLRDANMWDIIGNRNTFLQVNEDSYRTKGKTKEVSARLKALLLDAQLVKLRKHSTYGKKANKAA
jgi:hypothetical protein